MARSPHTITPSAMNVLERSSPVVESEQFALIPMRNNQQSDQENDEETHHQHQQQQPLEQNEHDIQLMEMGMGMRTGDASIGDDVGQLQSIHLNRPIPSHHHHDDHTETEEDDDDEHELELHYADDDEPTSTTQFVYSKMKIFFPALVVILAIILIAALVLVIPSRTESSIDVYPNPNSPLRVSCRFGSNTSTMVDGRPAPSEVTPPNTLIAYIGDVALASQTLTTLHLYKMIKDEKPEAIVIQGDLDYQDCPGGYDSQLSTYFGSDFPVFPIIGNHDEPAFFDYSAVIAERWRRANITTCNGEAGRQHVCTYKGIVFAQVTPGIFDFNTSDTVIAPYLDRVLREYKSPWQVCSWHKNQAKMQTGAKTNGTQWGVYDTCRLHGAMIATGHEHSWSRTYLMTNFEHQTVASTNGSYLALKPGESFAFVNGLGGRSVRGDLICSKAGSCPWWASKVNADTGVKAAALFCRYHVRGIPTLADCYLKDIDGRILDQFTIDASGLNPNSS